MAPGGSLCAKIRFRSNAHERQGMWLAVNRLDIILIDRPLSKPRSVVKTYSIFSCKWNLYGRQMLYWFFCAFVACASFVLLLETVEGICQKNIRLLTNVFLDVNFVYMNENISPPYFLYILSGLKYICIKKKCYKLY